MNWYPVVFLPTLILISFNFIASSISSLADTSDSVPNFFQGSGFFWSVFRSPPPSPRLANRNLSWFAILRNRVSNAIFLCTTNIVCRRLLLHALFVKCNDTNLFAIIFSVCLCLVQICLLWFNLYELKFFCIHVI